MIPVSAAVKKRIERTSHLEDITRPPKDTEVLTILNTVPLGKVESAARPSGTMRSTVIELTRVLESGIVRSLIVLRLLR